MFAHGVVFAHTVGSSEQDTDATLHLFHWLNCIWVARLSF